MSSSKIRVLDQDTIAKISAGEVVERPASVVKELVENSIDSGARRIEIEVKDGGKSLIRVTDDGCGMTKEEALLSLERHSTSKISSADDLFAITTLGFRGEALPSIAAVSKFELLTRSRSGGGQGGVAVRAEGSGERSSEEIGIPDGTTIKAADLFFNTPARKKFLKSTSTELFHIVDIVSKYVLACPAVSFKLVHNGETLIFSSGSGELLDAVSSVHGAPVAKNLIEVDGPGPVGVSGYVSGPTLTRVDREYQSFFVNGRSVKNFLLSRALEDAYRNLIPGDRHPICALFIKIDPAQVDVNVHPTKREVRFARTNEVLQAVRDAVSKALGVKPDGGLRGAPDISFGSSVEWKPEMSEALFGGIEGTLQMASQENPRDKEGLYPICQIFNTYIIASDGDGFVLIDQHAAHERIVYEELKTQDSGLNTNSGEGQALLIPQNLELNQSDAVVLRENLDYLKKLNFSLEEFGANSFLIRSVPVQLSGISALEVLLEVLSQLKTFGSQTTVEEKKEAMLKLIACHGAVRSGDRLSQDEMSFLIKRMGEIQNPHTCPHGRPTMIKFGISDLEKMFKRS